MKKWLKSAAINKQELDEIPPFREPTICLSPASKSTTSTSSSSRYLIEVASYWATMNKGKWLNKNEVLRDLQEVCGRPATKHVYKDSLTEIRDKPPVAVTCEDDEETFLYMMGCRRGDNNIERNERTEPDLPCISHWLDQVKKTEGQQSNNDLDHRSLLLDRNNALELTKLTSTVQKPTPQLDPTVEAFIPRTVLVNTETKCDIIPSTNNVSIHSSGNNKADDMVSEVIGIDEMQPDAYFNIENETDDKICTENGLQQKYLNEVQTLKDKINNIPTTGSFQNKTERNIALSKLMQLLANPHVPNNNNNTPVKLLTPEHFVSSVPEAPKPSFQQHQVPIINVIDSKISTLISATNILPATTEETNDNPNEQESPSRIIESVKKVNDWFKHEKPVVEIKPTIHFAPPTYKRKEKSVKTPECKNTPTIRSVTSSPSTTACKKFVPSRQADELYQKFFKDSNEKKMEKPVSIWDNLERQLKEKDKEIRQKKQESLSN